MTPQSELEIKGNFYTHPGAELLAEIAQAGLNGSLRATGNGKKCVFYFKQGQIVFAASNSRSIRLFEVLVERGRISKDDLVQIPNFSNDLELAKFLTEKNLITQAESDRLFKDQIESVVVDLLTWVAAEWDFSPLARIRDGLSFDIDVISNLVNYSRCLPDDAVLTRFRTLDETFQRSGISELDRDLTLDEGFVMSRAADLPLSASTIISLSAMPETKVLRSLYTLWLGGLLIRDNWKPAFSSATITAIKSAKLELKTEAKVHQTAAPPSAVHDNAISEKAENTSSSESAENPDETIQKDRDAVVPLEEYLVRVENAATFYDILGVDSKADVDELKRSYFFLAKNFHPDRYHAVGGQALKRIQRAFTELAQAHETLKNPQTREIYDYRMRKELAERQQRQAAGETGSPDMRIQQAADNFDRGYDLLMENEPTGAIPFLARAAHFAPQNARYRAYYGHALASDDKQRHKAEAELQAALKIDPNNATFRIMLAEFFVQFNLIKRAEGELNRLLAIFPSNREARDMLEQLKS